MKPRDDLVVRGASSAPMPRPPSVRRLASLIRPYSWQLTVASLIVIAISGVGLVAPKLAGRVLDSALIEKDQDQLTTIVVALGGLFALRGLLRYLQTYLVGSAGARLLASLRARLLDHLLCLSPGFYADRHTGELISRITTDIGKVQTALIDKVPDGVQATVTFLGTVSMLVLIRGDLALLTLIIVPPIVAVALVYGRALMRLSTRSADATADATQVASESLSGLSTVQAFSQERRESERHGSRLARMVALDLRYAHLLGGFSGLMQFLGFGAFAVVLWYGGRLVARDEMSPGDLTAFLLYTFGVAGSVGTLGSLYSTVKSLRGAAARIFEILDTEPIIRDPASPKELPSAEGAVRFDEVAFSYPSRPESRALDNLSLDIESKRTLALVGPSGGGKSTIFALLMRFYDPDAGRISVDGLDIRDLRLEELRSQIAIVPQDIFLFSGTIAENIAYGVASASREEISQAAELAGALEFIEKLPNKLDERVGERGIRLSVGQRQRIAIARAFLRQPRVLLLDEATSALDPDSEAIVQDALAKLMSGRTTIVIAHRLATAKSAHRIAVMTDGRISDIGSHDALHERSEVYRRYWELQSLGAPIG